MQKPLNGKIKYLEAPNRAKFPYCNCLLIDDEISALIDSSCGTENLNFLLQHPPDVIVNSHFHEDHILNNYLFPQARIWIHDLDAAAACSLEVYQEYYGFQKFEGQELGRGFIKSIDLHASPVHQKISGGQILDFGTVHLRVIHTPGHTPGHCGFYEENNGILFSGDIDLTGFGPWYAHDCSNIDDFIHSIDKCIEINPNLIISCHKGIIEEDITKKLKQYKEIIYTKERQVLQHLREPATLDDLADKQLFFGAHVKLDPFMFWMEKMAIHKHLERLMRLGQAAQNEKIFYLK
ncbi:MAG: MBL fold metallo-hydrolase [Syntrophomonadaceae bacterium]|nr:MBL fold metallo-hydrolase [Syntrophomonadaceae bacterium]MDD3023994.1 MBL fold metallo-hydrolase [Syntrophomonadaceae bacterium]